MTAVYCLITVCGVMTHCVPSIYEAIFNWHSLKVYCIHSIDDTKASNMNKLY